MNTDDQLPEQLHVRALKVPEEKKTDDEIHDTNSAASTELTADKVKWLQEQAFQKKNYNCKANDDYNEAGAHISNELTGDKVKWLQEQAFTKKNAKNQNEEPVVLDPISNELTGDKVKWLQEQAFPKKNTHAGTCSADITKSGQQQQPNEPKQQLSEDDFDSADESQDESESDEESQEESFADTVSDIPQGKDTDDLYALLAYSKGRIQDRNLLEEGNVDDDEDDVEQAQEQNRQHDPSDGENDDDHELDDDLSQDSSVSHESFDGLDDVDNNNDDDYDNDNAVKEESPNTDTANSTSASAAVNTNTNEGIGIATSTRDFRKQQKQKETDELWALLNYSKVRLATGATPTNAEAQALGMSQEESTAVRKSPVTSEHLGDRDHDDDDSYDSKASDDYSSLGDDDNDDSDDDELLITINQEEIAATRARALAALARTKDIGMDDDHDAMSNLRPMAKSQSPGKTGSGGGSGMLTEQQMLKSIALAEEEARNGATEFSTRKKLSILDKVKTPTFQRVVEGSRGRGRGGGGGANRDVVVEVNNFKEKARSFWNDSKKKAEKAMKDIKANVARVERQSKNQTPNDNGMNSAGIRLKEDSPFQKFSQNIAKVEKRDEEKYGNSTSVPFV